MIWMPMLAYPACSISLWVDTRMWGHHAGWTDGHAGAAQRCACSTGTAVQLMQSHSCRQHAEQEGAAGDRQAAPAPVRAQLALAGCRALTTPYQDSRTGELELCTASLSSRAAAGMLGAVRGKQGVRKHRPLAQDAAMALACAWYAPPLQPLQLGCPPYPLGCLPSQQCSAWALCASTEWVPHAGQTRQGCKASPLWQMMRLLTP